MRNQQPQGSMETIELAPGIAIQAFVPQEHIPALRAGFALFPANPRWSALKFQAWNSGRRLRQAVDRGETKVGNRHLVLVTADAQVEPPAPQPLIEACLSAVKRLLWECSYAGL